MVSKKVSTLTQISISKGNAKLGNVPSFSLPAGRVQDGASCINSATCAGKFNPDTGNGGCYAMTGTFMFPVVVAAYKRNMSALRVDEAAGKNDVMLDIDAFLNNPRRRNKIVKFRFDVSGDVISHHYRDMQINLAINNPQVKFVKYTKVYGFYKGMNEVIPSNMSVLFSWFVDASRDQAKQIERFIRYSANKAGSVYPMAITSMDAIKTFKVMRKLGRKPALCPAQTLDKVVNCDKCNLCFDANAKGIDIVFQHHARKKDEKAFRERYHGEFKHLRML